MNLEGRVQRVRRAVLPPCPDELAWISKLAARFDVDVPRTRQASSPRSRPSSSATSHSTISGCTHRFLRDRPTSHPIRRRRPITAEVAADALRLHRYRPLFSGPAVERVPELGFLRPERDVELSPADAEARGIASGDAVIVRSNGTSVELRARVNRKLLDGVVRVADEHAGELHPSVEVVKA